MNNSKILRFFIFLSLSFLILIFLYEHPERNAFQDGYGAFEHIQDDHPVHKGSAGHIATQHEKGQLSNKPNEHQASKAPWMSTSDLHSNIDLINYQVPLGTNRPLKKCMLMVKTGATVLWQRLPMHLFTTFSRFPTVEIYSDAPAIIGGLQVHDALANISNATKNSDYFQMYQWQKTLHEIHSNADPTEAPLKPLDIDPYTRLNGWSLDKFKNLPMLMHAYEQHPNNDWYIFMDGDSYLLLDNLERMLQQYDPSEHLYLGCRRWYDSADYTQYLFAQGGSGVILSRHTLKSAYAKKDLLPMYEERTHSEIGGDDMVAIFLKREINVTVTHSPGFFEDSIVDAPLSKDDWCMPVYSFHHMTSRQIEILWEYENTKRVGSNGDTGIVVADIYRDMILPYIDDLVPHWDNRITGVPSSLEEDIANNVTITSGSDRPYYNVETCRRHCVENNNCLCWRYRSGSKPECRISDEIRIGTSALSWQKSVEDNTDYTSGWMISRIREIRNASSCDDTSMDGPKSEGWYRQTHKIL